MNQWKAVSRKRRYDILTYFLTVEFNISNSGDAFNNKPQNQWPHLQAISFGFDRSTLYSIEVTDDRGPARPFNKSNISVLCLSNKFSDTAAVTLTPPELFVNT